jgi:hypothetical protein
MYRSIAAFFALLKYAIYSNGRTIRLAFLVTLFLTYVWLVWRVAGVN